MQKCPPIEVTAAASAPAAANRRMRRRKGLRLLSRITIRHIATELAHLGVRDCQLQSCAGAGVPVDQGAIVVLGRRWPDTADQPEMLHHAIQRLRPGPAPRQRRGNGWRTSLVSATAVAVAVHPAVALHVRPAHWFDLIAGGAAGRRTLASGNQEDDRKNGQPCDDCGLAWHAPWFHGVCAPDRRADRPI